MSRLSPAPVVPPLLAGAATWLTLLSWSGLAERSSRYLVPLLLLTAGISVVGILLRSLRLPGLVVVLLQAAGTGLVLNAAWASSRSWGGVIPTPDSVRLVQDRIRVAAEAATEWAAPIPGDVTTFPPLLVLGGALVALVVDATACTLRQVPLAGLALLAAFTVPVAILGGVSWLTFALAAGAFVLLLAADQAVRLARWGRSVDEAPGGRLYDDQPRRITFASLLPTAARVGVVGIGVAVLVPALLPTRDSLLDRGGDGPGDGTRVTLVNPMVDMRRDLRRQDDTPLVEIETDQPRPSYLRLTVLDEFDGDSWEPSRRDIPDSQRAEGPMPSPPGLQSTTPRREYATRLRVLDFGTTWLPTPYPIREIAVTGDWRYDLDTLDLVNADKGMTAAGLDYEVVELDLEPEVQALVTAAEPPSGIERANTALPQLPAWIRDLADEVAAEADSPFEQAVALQSWFRTDGGFEYSLDRASGSSLEQLERFLGTGPGSRVGYCEQFASAMAMMARSLGIPARVAVGFLEPSPASGDRWVYSSDDLHAWPELYFSGVGWLRFEPTPPIRGTSVPDYTEGNLPEPSIAPLPTVSPGALEPSPDRPTSPEELTPTSSDGGFDPTWPLAALGGLLVAAAAVVGPRQLRSWKRRRRLAGADANLVEGAWAELQATAADLRLGWEDRGTLRRSALALAPRLRGAADATAALESLVLLLERARFSRSGLRPGEAEEAVRLLGRVTGALWESAHPRTQWRARWLPASLWRRSSRTGWPGPRTGGDSASTPSGDRVSV